MNNYDLNSPYTAKLLLDELDKRTEKKTKSLSYSRHIQGVIQNIPSDGYADVSINTTTTDTSPVIIENVKVRNDIGINIGDEVYLCCINGSLNNFFVDTNKSITSSSNYVRQPGYSTTGGTSTAYTVTLSPVPIAYVEGFGITIIPHTDCGNSPTLNVNTLGAVNLKKQNGTAYAAGEMKANLPYSFKKVGTSFLADSSGGLDSFFGDGSDGVYNSVGNTTLSVTAHTGIVIKQYTSFTLNAGHIYTVNNPCRGFILYVQGNVNISGTIDMSKLGGFGTGNIAPMLITKLNSGSSATVNQFYKLTTVLEALLGGAGGNGGNGGNGNGGTGGSAGSAGSSRVNLGGYGGGGGGAGSYNANGSVGGSVLYAELGGGQLPSVSITYDGRSTNVGGTNGSGGHGAFSNSNTATSNFGSTGKCNGGGGGGTGGSYANASTQTVSAANDGEYVGGFVCIICGGNIIINAGGYIKANGGNGGAGSNGSSKNPNTIDAGGGGGGGGSGGGVIALFYTGTYTNNGTNQVNGGTGGGGGNRSGTTGTNGSSGSSGSVGTILIQQIA